MPDKKRDPFFGRRSIKIKLRDGFQAESFGLSFFQPVPESHRHVTDGLFHSPEVAKGLNMIYLSKLPGFDVI